MNQYERQALVEQRKKNGGTGGTGGAGYNPNANENVGKALNDINSGNFKNNPNQGYIDFGKSGVLGKQDWINQNGIDTEDNSINVDERYQQYLGDYAKQNNINTEGLDLANWEQYAQQGNDWQNPYEGLDTENSIYTYIQQMLDDGKISDEDATYLANALTYQGVMGADGSYLDLASGWSDAKARKEAEKDSEWLKNWGGVTADANEVNDESNAIFDAMKASEITNQDDLFAAVDEWAEGKNPDLVRSMMETLDSSLAEYGIPSLTEAYMQHYNEGGAQAPANSAEAQIESVNTEIDDIETMFGSYEDGLRAEASKTHKDKDAIEQYVVDERNKAISRGRPEVEKLRNDAAIALKQEAISNGASEDYTPSAEEIDDYVYEHLGELGQDGQMAYYWDRVDSLRQTASDIGQTAYDNRRHDAYNTLARNVESGSYEDAAPVVAQRALSGAVNPIIGDFINYTYPNLSEAERANLVNQFKAAIGTGDSNAVTKLPYFDELVLYINDNVGLNNIDPTRRNP